MVCHRRQPKRPQHSKEAAKPVLELAPYVCLGGGSNNLIVGNYQAFPSYGGFVAGYGNTISGPRASVSGGGYSTASGSAASVSGGLDFMQSIDGGRREGALHPP